MMTSLLVDGRPIHGDPGLPEVMKVFSDLRRHPGTMRLLLEASLSARAKSRSLRDLVARRDTINLKKHAVLPIVNTARWAALAVGSSALSTTERLQAAAGSAMLPDEQAHNLIDMFTVLQRLRLRYQLIQYQRGEKPTDVVSRGPDVADRPQRGRRGRPGDRRRPAAHGQHRRLPARRGVDGARAELTCQPRR